MQKLFPDRLTWIEAVSIAATLSGISVSRATARRYLRLIKDIVPTDAKLLGLDNYNRTLTPAHVYLIAGIRIRMKECGTYKALRQDLTQAINRLELEGLINEFRNSTIPCSEVWDVTSKG